MGPKPLEGHDARAAQTSEAPAKGVPTGLGPGCAPKAGGSGAPGKGGPGARGRSPASVGDGLGGSSHRWRREGEGREEGRHPLAMSPTPRAPPAQRPAPTPRPSARVPARGRGGPTHSLSSSPPPPPPLGAAAAAAAMFRTAFTTALSERRERARLRRRDPARRTLRPALRAGMRAAAPARRVSPPGPQRARPQLGETGGAGRGLGGGVANWREFVSILAREKGVGTLSSCRLAAVGRHLGKRGGLGSKGLV